MSNKSFTFDLGRIMDDAFEWAQDFSEHFQRGMRGAGFPGAEELGEKLKDRFKCYEDLYPHYDYPPANIYLTREKSLVFEIALAGFEEQGISLEFRGTTCTSGPARRKSRNPARGCSSSSADSS